ncbi:MAG: glycine zipper 2TM domain-containing protein [Thiobacillaceae bacterium]
MKAKYATPMILISFAAFANSATASDEFFGAVLGGATGAVVGHALGGHDGAVAGGALGAVVGAVAASERSDHVVYYGPPRAAYGPPPAVVYAPPAVVYEEPGLVYAPPPVVVQSRPVYYGYYGWPGAWRDRDHWREQDEWRERDGRWGHSQGGRRDHRGW